MADTRWFADHSEVVNAPLDAVWAALLDKVAHPERFVAGITRVEIVAGSSATEGGGVERKMWPAGAPHPIHEIIRAWRSDDLAVGTVDFMSLEHPLIHGYVLNTVTAIDAGSSRLHFSMRWTRRASAPLEAKLPFADPKAAIVKAVQTTKAIVEAALVAAAATAPAAAPA